MFDRITFDPQIMGGRACIRGMRIPVSVIAGQIAHGATFEEILEGCPDLEREDIQQAIEYAAWLAQEQVYDLQEVKMRFLADMGVALMWFNGYAKMGMTQNICATRGYIRFPTVRYLQKPFPKAAWL